MQRVTGDDANKGFVSFDIETDGLIEAGKPPPRVLCACTVAMERRGIGNFVMRDRLEWVATDAISTGAAMATVDLCKLVDYLWEAWREGGLRIMGWNIAGFDMLVLYRHLQGVAPQHAQRVVALTLAGVDPMFSFFMHKGFPVGLNAVAMAMARGFGKSGAGGDVAEAWFGGGEADRRGVVAYCSRDTDVTASVMASVEAAGCIQWVTKASGKVAEWRPRRPLDVGLTVQAAMCLPEPDNSWMKAGDRPSRRGFVGWLR